jgi:hypothetical protein
MPPTGYEHAIAAIELSHSSALDRKDTGMGREGVKTAIIERPAPIFSDSIFFIYFFILDFHRGMNSGFWFWRFCTIIIIIIIISNLSDDRSTASHHHQ